MSELTYGFSKILPETSYEDALRKVIESLKDEGFGVLTKIDVKQTFKHKLDVDFRNYAILGACNPNLAHEALQHESHMGLMLPCNVVVQELPEGVEVSIADPKAMFTLVDNPAAASIAREADERLHRVMQALH